MWWDIRNLKPIERLMMDPTRTDDQVRSYGVSVLEYETTIPTRFMCGTQQGMLFSCNRKGKSPTEKINIRVGGEKGDITGNLNEMKRTFRLTAISDPSKLLRGIQRSLRISLRSEISLPRFGLRTARRVRLFGRKIMLRF